MIRDQNLAPEQRAIEGGVTKNVFNERQPSVSVKTERILQAVAHAAARFLHAGSWEECIDDVLAHLGSATGADQLLLLRVIAESGAPSLRVCSMWHAPDHALKIDLQALPLSEWSASAFLPWFEQLRNGQPVHGLVSDFADAPRQALRSLGVRSLGLLPVFASQTWWGLLVLNDSSSTRDLTPSQFDALRVAADSLGAAIGRRQAELQLHRRNHELHVLNSVIAAATTTLEPHTVLHTTCRELAHAFKVPTAGAALIDETGRSLEIVAEHMPPGGFSALGAKIPIEGNLSTQFVLQNKQPLIIGDVQSDPRMASIRQLMRKRHVASIMILPLIADDEVVGTLGLDSPEPFHFGDEELSLAMSAVSAASQVLAKARLLAAEQENTARLEKILALSTDLAGIRNEQALLDTLVQRAADFSPSGSCTVFLVDDDVPEEQQDSVVMRAQHGLNENYVGMRVPVDHPLVQGTLRQQAPLIVANVDRDAPQLRQFLVRPEVRSVYIYPFFTDDGPIGFITFTSLISRHPPPAEVSALQLLAERTAAALQNVRLLNAVRDQAAQLAALHEVDVAISNSLEPEEVYKTITHSAALLLNCDLVNLYRWRPELAQLEGLATFGSDHESVKGQLFDDNLNPNFSALRDDQQPIAIADATSDARVGSFWLDKIGMRAVLRVPLLYHDQFTGLLALNDTRRARHWSTSEIELARALAAQAAIAVANARLHAETRELLQRSRQQARTVQQIVDTVAEGLLLLDPQQRVVVANPVAADYLALVGREENGRLQALGGVPLSQLLRPPPDGEHPFHELVVEGPQRRVFELSAQLMEAEPFAGGWLLVMHEATHEREQQAYVQAQDRLATVGQLAAGIAHDFNNILSVIVLYAQTLQRADVSPKDRDRLRAIYQQAQRASSLISQILDFSRRSVVERQPFELQPFLEDLAQMLARTLPETIVVQLQADHADAVVNVDPTRLQQALMNLALNARDAMSGVPSGGSPASGGPGLSGGELRITLSRYDAEWKPPLPDMRSDDWVAISVADTGPGIQAAVLPHIFEPFFTTKMPGQGTGLGLAQVYGIVKQHDGFIDVHSQPGAGATFTIYLPAFQLPQPAATSPQAMVGSGAGELILVVEDDPAIQDVVGEVLEMLNYRVLVAADGVEALTAYGGSPEKIDLVLSDMVMPNMDGARLYHALRAHDPDVKMVMFTGYPLDEAGKTFVEDQGVAWIQKPFTAEALDAILRRTLQG